MKMGRSEMRLIFIMFCSTMANSSSLQQIFSTESNYHQQTKIEKHGQDGVGYRIGRKYSASLVTVSHLGGGGGRGGGGGGGGRGGGGGGGGRGKGSGRGGGRYIGGGGAGGSAQASQGRSPNAGARHENSIALLVAAVLAVITHMYSVF